MQNNVRNKKIDRFAKLLILFSFFIFFIGFSIDVYYKHFRIIDPVKDTSPVNQNIITVETHDGHEGVTSIDNPINNIPAAPEVSNNDNVNQTPSDDNKENNNELNNQDNNSNNISEVQNDTISDLVIINDNLRKKMQKKYNVTVEYGSETIGYKVGGLTTVPIDNPSTINNSLIRLDNVLSLYPDDIFLEEKNGGIPLRIILINNYSNDTVTGVTDSSYTYADISIAVCHPLEESFFHESYHYFERYMFKLGANFNAWNSLNPADFSYGTIYNNLSYSNSFAEDAPFVNNYSQSDDAEDRASTFEYMMASSKASCLNSGKTVWQKATYMARNMDLIFDSVKPDITEYWERFL